MNYVDLSLLALAIGMVGFLYSSVGHAGASGYIAVMALAGIAPAIIRPTALGLNILVATIAGFQFWRAGHLSWRFFWPFAVLSVPAAYLGGYWQLSGSVFRLLLGLILLFSAVHLIFRRSDSPDVAPPSTPAAIGVGGGIGLLSGLTGTGGGIFLTPLLLVCRWAHIRQAAAVSALFILVNSIAGLGGYLTGSRAIPSLTLVLAPVVIVAGFLGSYFGSLYFQARTICRLLATVLLIAAAKLFLTH